MSDYQGDSSQWITVIYFPCSALISQAAQAHMHWHPLHVPYESFLTLHNCSLNPPFLTSVSTSQVENLLFKSSLDPNTALANMFCGQFCKESVVLGAGKGLGDSTDRRL